MKTLLPLSLMCALFGLGCKVSSPGNIESSLMKEVKQTVTIGGKADKNPLVLSPEVLRKGQEHFIHHCGICHGNDGHATGVPFAATMSPPVPDLAGADVQSYTDGQLHWIVQNGISPSGMPAWSRFLTDDEIWYVVHYMRHLPAKGSLGIPAIYQEEAEEHSPTEHKLHSPKIRRSRAHGQ